MAGDRQTVYDRVLDEYDVLYGFRPEKPQAVGLEGDDRPDAAELVSSLRTKFGISEEEPDPSGTLEDLIDYLHERWDGVTYEDEAEDEA